MRIRQEHLEQAEARAGFALKGECVFIKMKMNILLLLFFVSVFTFSGCVKTEETPKAEISYTFTDALGNEVNLSEPKRVVALMGSFAETWLLAGGSLVGVTEDAFGERDIGVPKDTAVVGKNTSPNMEEIVALDPDFVILSSETQEHVALGDSLTNANISHAYFSVTYFEDYLDMLNICTDITGRKDLYKENGEDKQERVNGIIEEANKKEPPTVLYMITYSGGARVQTSGSMTGRMLQELGCINIADRNPSLLKQFSIEQIMVEDPDFILVVPMGNNDILANQHLKEFLEANPAWNGLSAVLNEKYFVLPKEKFLYKPNARWGDSYEYLSDILW